jgi:hypothetical protein
MIGPQEPELEQRRNANHRRLRRTVKPPPRSGAQTIDGVPRLDLPVSQ